jgi:hypothetical protein
MANGWVAERARSEGSELKNNEAACTRLVAFIQMFSAMANYAQS